MLGDQLETAKISRSTNRKAGDPCFRGSEAFCLKMLELRRKKGFRHVTLGFQFSSNLHTEKNKSLTEHFRYRMITP